MDHTIMLRSDMDCFEIKDEITQDEMRYQTEKCMSLRMIPILQCF